MKKQDARRLTHKELTDIGQRAIHAAYDGESPEVVGGVMGLPRQALTGVQATSKSELAKKAIGYLWLLQKPLVRVANYFKHPKIAYAV